MKKNSNHSTFKKFTEQYVTCIPAYVAVFIFIVCTIVVALAFPEVANNKLLMAAFVVHAIGGALYMISAILLDVLTDTCWHLFEN